MPLTLLPNHPSLTSQVPFGICSSGQDSVAQIVPLRTLIDRASDDLAKLESARDELFDVHVWIERFERLLQDIACSLHGDTKLDAAGLQQARLGSVPSDLATLRANVFNSALDIEKLFPEGSIRQLSEDHESTTISPAQVDCLLAHMFLGTLPTLTGSNGGRPGFTQYYADNMVSAVPNTAIPYLDTLVAHFQKDGGYVASVPLHEDFTFVYSHARAMPEIKSCTLLAPRVPVNLIDTPKDPSDRDDAAFVLVAANARPGPGPGGTHEERLVGQSPALAIASLLAPVLPDNAAVITSSLPVHALWEGHGGEARMISLLPAGRRPARRYIIADALPLDLSHRQADLLESNVNREVRKLYAAFSGARRSWEARKLPLESLGVEMPPWGCGAFGGTLKVKMPCMMMAAGLAGLTSENLLLLVPRDREHDVWRSSGKELTVAALYAQVMNKTKAQSGMASLLEPIKTMLFGSM